MKQKKYSIIFTWIFVYISICFSIYKFNYVARENDTRVYSKLTAQLVERPLSQIGAPLWKKVNTFWSEKESPYVRDHPPGQYLLPVILGKLGLPKFKVIYFVNILYRILILYTFYFFSKCFVDEKVALFGLVALQLTPIGLTYQLRANHEHLMLLLAIMSVAIPYLIKNKKWHVFLTTFLLVYSFFIKGLIAGPIWCVTFFSYYNYYCLNNDMFKSITKSFKIISVAFFFLIISCYIFEYYFQTVTNYSFFKQYFALQFYKRSITDSTPLTIVSFIISIKYYLGRYVGYTLPWSLITILILIKQKKNNFFKLKISNNLFIYSLIFAIPFCFFSRIASRYVYSGLFFLAQSFILYIGTQTRFISKIETKYFHYFSALIFGFVAIFSIYKSRNYHLIYK